MSRRDRGPAIVAELGRPETPEETAARKAQDSRNHRDRQTTRNLVLALLASLGVVVLLVLVVPRGDIESRPAVDYRAVAQQAQVGIDDPLIVPEPGDEWSSNVAELRTGAVDGVSSWFIGFLTPENDFLGFSQGLDANESWVANELESARATGTMSIGGRDWTVYDHRAENGRGNLEYALTLESDGDYYVIYGSASDAEARTLAEATTQAIGDSS